MKGRKSHLTFILCILIINLLASTLPCGKIVPEAYSKGLKIRTIHFQSEDLAVLEELQKAIDEENERLFHLIESELGINVSDFLTKFSDSEVCFSPLCGVIIFGEGFTFPPVGVAWPILVWFANNTIGGAKSLIPSRSYVMWGKSTGVLFPFVGIEVTYISNRKPIFAIRGFALLCVAAAEKVEQID